MQSLMIYFYQLEKALEQKADYMGNWATKRCCDVTVMCFIAQGRKHFGSMYCIRKLYAIHSNKAPFQKSCVCIYAWRRHNMHTRPTFLIHCVGNIFITNGINAVFSWFMSLSLFSSQLFPRHINSKIWCISWWNIPILVEWNIMMLI